jgi:hypothetical protein
MSSKYVREELATFIATELPTETVVDLTAEFRTLEDLLEDAGVTGPDNWLGLQFIGSDEVPQALAATNNTGKYREVGAIYIHIVDVVKKNVHLDILDRAELVRNAFRGRRINSIIIESVSPPNFSTGVTLNFEGGYTSAAVILGYQRDLNL